MLLNLSNNERIIFIYLFLIWVLPITGCHCQRQGPNRQVVERSNSNPSVRRKRQLTVLLPATLLCSFAKRRSTQRTSDRRHIGTRRRRRCQCKAQVQAGEFWRSRTVGQNRWRLWRTVSRKIAASGQSLKSFGDRWRWKKNEVCFQSILLVKII